VRRNGIYNYYFRAFQTRMLVRRNPLNFILQGMPPGSPIIGVQEQIITFEKFVDMKERNKLVKVYTGTEMTVVLLKELLVEIGVSSTIQNNYKSGVEVGFVGGVQSSVDLFIQQSDFETAEPVIRDFIAQNNS
jgi:hypothetical protein